jgi:ammonia channel protein AmtB
MDACLGAIAWWLVGFAFAFGNGNPFIGSTYFATSNIRAPNSTQSYANWMFQVRLRGTARPVARLLTAAVCVLLSAGVG